ncbi:uncharacterized protein LOC124183595 [Neodiprion fabricii]|uniref:uncharacterized protein LOC124183595 n=1 Tax=Neodiprion fabricii TaxID=2872261 RepID=UPI001ED97A99|nr:uncharacterized protein LOC124183595 [Neodiprion fabricii]
MSVQNMTMNLSNNARCYTSKSSGKKYPIFSIRDLVPGHTGPETSEAAMAQIAKPRSERKCQPVRISMAYFNDPSDRRNTGSSRKTPGRPLPQPIRNIHKLFESPKNNARKRLDSLYDSSKRNENVNHLKRKSRLLNGNKIVPRLPDSIAAREAEPTRKPSTVNPNGNLRCSRLLPPGSITSSFINKRNSTAVRSSIYKPVNHVLVDHKNVQSGRPSNVPEESSLISETHDENLSIKPSTTSLINFSANQIEDAKKDSIHSVSTPSSPKQNQKSTKCCNCSQLVVDSNTVVNISTLTDKNIKDSQNTLGIVQPDSDVEKAACHRPTVIVMQKEVASQAQTNFDVGVELEDSVFVQDGSYSEVLSLQPPANSVKSEESTTFQRIKNATEENRDAELTEFTSHLIDMKNEVLVFKQKQLIDEISHHEKYLANLKLELKNVNIDLDNQKIRASNLKLEGWRSLSNEDMAFLVYQYNGNTNERFDRRLNAQELSVSDNNGNRLKNTQEYHQQTAETAELRKSSSNEKLQSDKDKNDDLSKHESTNLAVNIDKIENIENEPPTRRRSVRLAMKNANQSLPVSHSTPVIKNGKFAASQSNNQSKPPCTPNMTTTPGQSNAWKKKNARSLREYMVLKSANKFLNTPDVQRYRMGSDEKVKIQDTSSMVNDGLLLTDKLLSELHDLHATPQKFYP